MKKVVGGRGVACKFPTPAKGVAGRDETLGMICRILALDDSRLRRRPPPLKTRQNRRKNMLHKNMHFSGKTYQAGSQKEPQEPAFRDWHP